MQLTAAAGGELAALLDALGAYGTPDDEAAIRLLRECRQKTPDATADEVVHFIHDKAKLFLKRNYDNPIGALLVAVPKCFGGDSFTRFRQDRAPPPSWQRTRTPTNATNRRSSRSSKVRGMRCPRMSARPGQPRRESA